MKATMELAWFARDTHESMGMFLRDSPIHMDVGWVDVGWFLGRKGVGLPDTIWFTSDFLAFLAGENNCANIIDDEGNQAPVGTCNWQQFFDPPPSRWPIPQNDEKLREFVKANYQGRQYVWELVDNCEAGCHFKGVWRD